MCVHVPCPVYRERERETEEMAENGEFSFTSRARSTGRNGLPRIQANNKNKETLVCHDDSATPVKAKTIDELHSLQKKRSTPSTPIKSPLATGTAADGSFAVISEEERQRQQLQSIRHVIT